MFHIIHNVPAVVLAPMEGVTDYAMRRLLTEIGGFDLSVSEFIRVSWERLPDRVILDHLPELSHEGALKGRTLSGCPVMLQILGGIPELVAETALQGVRLGALGIDLNFGCPSPTVNRSDGGAILLKHPDRIQSIVKAVRSVVPSRVPVSAKLRLGWDSITPIFENVTAAEEGGADWVTVHARTRTQGYAPPVHWEILRDLRASCKVPVVVNGDIRDCESFDRARELTGANHFMIGRGALGDPKLSLNIRRRAPDASTDWRMHLMRFEELATPIGARPDYVLRRMKQWLAIATKVGRIGWFDAIKQSRTMAEFWHAFDQIPSLDAGA